MTLAPPRFFCSDRTAYVIHGERVHVGVCLGCSKYIFVETRLLGELAPQGWEHITCEKRMKCTIRGMEWLSSPKIPLVTEGMLGL